MPNGFTIQSCFGAFKIKAQAKLQNEYSTVLAVIVDEVIRSSARDVLELTNKRLVSSSQISMVGANLMALILSAFRSIWPDSARRDPAFSERLFLACVRCFVLCRLVSFVADESSARQPTQGDFAQLPPVNSASLASTLRPLKGDDGAARAIFQSMPNVITLNEQMRAAGDRRLVEFFERLRARRCTVDDAAMLEARRVDELGDARVLSAVDRGHVIICENNALREALSNVAVRRLVSRRAAAQGVQLEGYAAHDMRVADMANSRDDAARAVDVAAVRSRRRTPLRPLEPAMKTFIAGQPAARTGKLSSTLWYFPGLPVVIVDNGAAGPRGVQLGIANGVSGRLVGRLHDLQPTIDTDCVRYSAPPTCVFVLLDNALDKATGQYRQLVTGLPPGVVALFPINSGPFAVSPSKKNPARAKRLQVAIEPFLWYEMPIRCRLRLNDDRSKIVPLASRRTRHKARRSAASCT